MQPILDIIVKIKEMKYLTLILSIGMTMSLRVQEHDNFLRDVQYFLNNAKDKVETVLPDGSSIFIMQLKTKLLIKLEKFLMVCLLKLTNCPILSQLS